MRTYAQNCPVAVALDAIGDRWTLLVLRELALGDQRFTDLRTNLRGIAPNLLSARLSELLDRGYVEQAELPPPAARSVYRLTERGREVVPVLRALARFGARELPAPDRAPPMRPRGAVASLLAAWHRRSLEPPDAPPQRTRVVVDGTPTEVLHGPGGVEVVPADDRAPDLVVEVTSAALAASRRDGAPLAARYASGHDGPAHAPRDRFLTAFTLHEPEAALTAADGPPQA